MQYETSEWDYEGSNIGPGEAIISSLWEWSLPPMYLLLSVFLTLQPSFLSLLSNLIVITVDLWVA